MYRKDPANIELRARVARTGLGLVGLLAWGLASFGHADAVAASDQGPVWRELRASTPANDAYGLFVQVKSWLSEHPERIAPLVADLKALSADNADERRQMSLLYGALAESTCAQAGKGLVELLRGSSSAVARVQAAAALGDQVHPPVEALVALWHEAQHGATAESRNVALLAVGSVAHHRPSLGPEVSRRLLEMAAQSKEPKDQTALLAAMGNHGAVAYLPFAQAAATSSDDWLRAAAVYSVRYMPGGLVDVWLTETAVKDQSRLVKDDALRALAAHLAVPEDLQRVARIGLSSGVKDTQLLAARILQSARINGGEAAKNRALATLAAQTKFRAVRDLIGVDVAH